MYPKDLPRNRTSPITEKQGRWRRQFVQEYLSGHRIGTKQSGDDYFAEMKPLLYSLKLLGRFPYRIGVIPLKGVSWGVVYTLFAYLVQAAWTANTGRIICSVMSKPKINYDDTLFWFSSIVFLTLNLCVPFSYWLDAPSVVAYMKQWKKYQEEFASNMKGEKISLRLKRFVLAIVLTNPPGAALCLIAENFLLTNMSWYDLLPYTFAYSSCNLTYLFWAANCYEIARISETLSKKTVEAIRARNSEGLRRCRCLWIGLSLLARGLGCSLGLTGLLNTTILSGCFILTCYALLTAIINNQFIDSILSLVILLPVNFTYTFILVDTAHKATQKVGMDFSSVVIKESRMLSDEMCQKEVSLLLNAINTNPPVITLNGFVDVNRALFASLLSSTITYLVVLVQFKSSSYEIIGGNSPVD